LNLVHVDLVRQIVPPSKPREEAGMYWGYKVRYASQLSSVFKECPFEVIIMILVSTSFYNLDHISCITLFPNTKSRVVTIIWLVPRSTAW